MAKEKRKSNPIGVRFDKDLLEGLTLASIVDSPQRALNLYEKSYLELVDLKVKLNNEPEKKKEILDEREKVSEVISDYPLQESDVTPSKEKKMSMKERIAIGEEEYFKSKNI